MDLEKKDIKIMEDKKVEEVKSKTVTVELREGFEAFILPIKLGARRNALENELHSVVVELTELRLKNGLTELFKNFGLDGTFTVSWDFYPESDDSGGTYTSITDLVVSSEENPEFDVEEVTAELKFSHSDGTYEAGLYDELYDFFSGFSSDIEETDSYEMTIIVPKGE